MILFFEYQYDFRQAFRAQHCLKSLIKKCKRTVGKGTIFADLLKHLPKPLDYLLRNLAISKHSMYGFGISSASTNNNTLIMSYRKLKT